MNMSLVRAYTRPVRVSPKSSKENRLALVRQVEQAAAEAQSLADELQSIADELRRMA